MDKKNVKTDEKLQKSKNREISRKSPPSRGLRLGREIAK